MTTPRRFTWRAAAAVLCGAAAIGGWPAAHAADVGVSIGISQPGVYGRIDIGRFPQPTVVVTQPVVVAPVRHAPPPVYLWVPPGHQKHWAKHCRAYGACGVPVYFVRDDWYRQHVMVDRHDWAPPHEHRDDRRHGGRHEGRGEGRGDGRGERHGHRD
ncbi:hypothetical protein AACH10_02950 [Ideonella sp. DXS22W]|uniref:Lipoprotein n=1 Tax=Pseudaquabacterium inlustre TaxID=2984192 RepID=A0ABU9CBQ3_9BURK